MERARFAEQGCDLLGERAAQVGQILPRLEPAHELRRCGHADIGADQRLLEPLPRRVVAGIERGRRQFGRERPAALRQRVPQPREEPGALRLRLGLRVLLAEEL